MTCLSAAVSPRGSASRQRPGPSSPLRRRRCSTSRPARRSSRHWNSVPTAGSIWIPWNHDEPAGLERPLGRSPEGCRSRPATCDADRAWRRAAARRIVSVAWPAAPQTGWRSCRCGAAGRRRDLKRDRPPQPQVGEEAPVPAGQRQQQRDGGCGGCQGDGGAEQEAGHYRRRGSSCRLPGGRSAPEGPSRSGHSPLREGGGWGHGAIRGPRGRLDAGQVRWRGVVGMGTATVLVVDDERKIRDTVRLFLERQRYAVLLASTGQQALDVAGRLKPDLVVLDLMLPDLPGEEVARSLRTISQVPIIMLTAKAEEADRVAGLRLGADDYVVKPFSPLELVARVDAVLRRARPGGAEGVLSFDQGRLVLDQAAREVRLDGVEVVLTRK